MFNKKRWIFCIIFEVIKHFAMGILAWAAYVTYNCVASISKLKVMDRSRTLLLYYYMLTIRNYPFWEKIILVIYTCNCKYMNSWLYVILFSLDHMISSDDVTHITWNTISEEKPENISKWAFIQSKGRKEKKNDKSVHDGFGIWKGIRDGLVHAWPWTSFYFFLFIEKLNKFEIIRGGEFCPTRSSVL